MVLHGDRDEVVPIEQGRRVYDAANEPKRFYEITGAAHDDTFIVGQEPYFRAIADFIASLRG